MRTTYRTRCVRRSAETSDPTIRWARTYVLTPSNPERIRFILSDLLAQLEASR